MICTPLNLQWKNRGVMCSLEFSMTSCTQQIDTGGFEKERIWGAPPFGRFSDFWKIFRFLEDFQIFRKFSDFWKIFRFLNNPRTCDIWDTDYNSDNWEPEFMTIFVIWQLIVTLDSIRNSCDVLFMFINILSMLTLFLVFLMHIFLLNKKLFS